ncbi:unnamed protein product, partial [Closterium sp. NIES-53]
MVRSIRFPTPVPHPADSAPHPDDPGGPSPRPDGPVDPVPDPGTPPGSPPGWSASPPWTRLIR